jgi:hypothetical protein
VLFRGIWSMRSTIFKRVVFRSPQSGRALLRGIWSMRSTLSKGVIYPVVANRSSALGGMWGSVKVSTIRVRAKHSRAEYVIEYRVFDVNASPLHRC